MDGKTSDEHISASAPRPPRVAGDPGETPVCFGVLETVFPMGEDGLRSSPEECLGCTRKTACLQAAMAGPRGGEVRGEILDRAYSAGAVGFLERWSRKKDLHRKSRMKKTTKKKRS